LIFIRNLGVNVEMVPANCRCRICWELAATVATMGGPKGRYVANLGHVQDDESGLIYMRARYYEPESGRFVSEDLARDGSNWFLYCANQPTMQTDPTGNANGFLITGWALFALGNIMAVLAGAAAAGAVTAFQVMNAAQMAVYAILVMSIGAAVIAIGAQPGPVSVGIGIGALISGFIADGAWDAVTAYMKEHIAKQVAMQTFDASVSGKTYAGPATTKLFAHSMMMWSFVIGAMLGL
jgi:RHS repeat-associated protein